jgi:hypothetical protein
MKVSLRPGLVTHRTPFAGALLVDRESLTVVEVDEEVAGLLVDGRPVEVGTLRESLRTRLQRGVAEGWLREGETT